MTSIAIVGTGFITSIVLSRWLGPTGRGELTSAVIVATILPYIASTGLTTSVLYHAGSSNLGPSRTLSTALPIGFVQAAVFGVAAYSLLPLFLGGKGPGVLADARFALIALPPALLTFYICSAFQAEMQFGIFNLLRCLVPVGTLLGVIGLGVAGRLTVGTTVAVYSLLPFVVIAYALRQAQRLRLVTSVRPQRAVAKRLLAYGVKAQAGEIANTLNLRLDQLVIAAWLPSKELGLYVAALSASQGGSMISYAIGSVVQARMVNETDEGRRRDLFRIAVRRYILAGGPLCIVTVAVAGFAIPLLFGQEFRPAVAPARILAVASFILGYKGILAGVAQAYGQPWLASKAELLGMVVTIVALALAIPLLGINGAAIASALAYATQAWVIGWGLRRRSASIQFVDP